MRRTLLFVIGCACLVYLLLVFRANIANAACVEHTVTKHDTFKSLAKTYYGSESYYQRIKVYNNIRKLIPKETVQIYVPDKDWRSACERIIIKRLIARKVLQEKQEVIVDITDGIESAGNILGLTPFEKLDMCRYAITTTQIEAGFTFRVGAAGEIGMYQFKVETARSVMRKILGNNTSFSTDKEIVELLLNAKNATEVFVFHFRDLLRKHRYSVWRAWFAYNGGRKNTDAIARDYANRLQKLYYEVWRIRPMVCETQEIMDWDFEGNVLE